MSEAYSVNGQLPMVNSQRSHHSFSFIVIACSTAQKNCIVLKEISLNLILIVSDIFFHGSS